ncbi:MAG: efflux RND transporter periplasmic adaptor subunit [Muribaculaceae bacterium]|nr:efflux RND transporter periplasmic adaptor subunit [Muribaculaceae bacterium]
MMTTAALAAVLTACSKKDVDYDASGIFETTEVVVSARGNGEIELFNVEEGQQLTAGTEVGYIDTLQLDLQRRQLLANMSAADSHRLNESRQLASLRQQIANLKTEKERFERLVKDNAATSKQLDDINYQIEVLEKQLAATSEQISSSNTGIKEQTTGIAAQIAQIDAKIADCIISSPVNGIVLAKYAEAGEYAATGKPLFKVGDISRMKLRAYVTAPQLTELHVGQEVKVYADLGESDRKEFNGKVIWISDEAEFTPKTIQTRDERSNLVYAVKILVDNDGTIKRGMYGDVKF